MSAFYKTLHLYWNSLKTPLLKSIAKLITNPCLCCVRRESWLKNWVCKIGGNQTPCAIIADATFLKPAILAPKTKLVGSLNSLAV